jgi:hypothetical protein
MRSYVTTEEVLHMSKNLYATAVPNSEALDLSWHIYKAKQCIFFFSGTYEAVYLDDHLFGFYFSV